MRPGKIHIVFISGLIAAAAWWGWQYGRATIVSAVTAERGTAVEIVYATGAVEPVHWAKVTSLIRDRIVAICDCEGKPVSKGNVLVRLDDREAQAQLEELWAREDFARRELTRQTELIARGAATTQAYERVSMDLKQIQALISVQLEKISDYAIAAPMDRIILRRDGEVGEIAEVGQILFRVGVPRPLQVVAEVNEEDIPRVEVGQSVLFRTDAFPERRLDGTVREVTPMGDSVAKTYRIKVTLPEATPLRPGMSVEANIVTREKPDALLVPTEAIQANAVLVIDGRRVRRRPVEVGLRGSRMVEVVSGIDVDTRIVSPAPEGLRDGQSVRIRQSSTSQR
jgi:RND family efflux transporter MFP subunit